MSRFSFDYDYENDGLFIYASNAKSNYSLEIGSNITIDIGKHNTLVGIEVLDASEVLNALIPGIRITKKVLKNIKKVDLDLKNMRQMSIIYLKIYSEVLDDKVTISLPAQIKEKAPILAYA